LTGQDKLPVPDGIQWRGWSDETLREIAERERPVLLFVADPGAFAWPFLKEVFKAMPANAKLRTLLHETFIALFIKAGELPEELKDLGAGSSYHIAILSPYGLTHLVTFNPVHGNPAEIVAEITQVLERLAETWN